MDVRQQGDLVILDLADLRRRKSPLIACGLLCSKCSVYGGIQIPDLGGAAPAFHTAEHVTAHESFIVEEKYGLAFIRNVIAKRKTLLKHPSYPDIPLKQGSHQIRKRRRYSPRKDTIDRFMWTHDAQEIWPKEFPALHGLDRYDQKPQQPPNHTAIEAALRSRLSAFDLPARPIIIAKGPLEAYPLVVGQAEDPEWVARLDERTPPINAALVDDSIDWQSIDPLSTISAERLEIMTDFEVTWSNELKTGIPDWITYGFNACLCTAWVEISNIVLKLVLEHSAFGVGPQFPDSLSVNLDELSKNTLDPGVTLKKAGFEFDREYLQCIFNENGECTFGSLFIPTFHTARHLAFIDALWSDISALNSNDRNTSVDFLDAYLNGMGGLIVTTDRIIAITQPRFCLNHDKLTAENGPAVFWDSGERQWFIDDEPVPDWVIEKPEEITVAHIRAEENAVLREIMIERYRGASGAIGVDGLIEDHGEMLSRSGNYSLHQVIIGVEPNDIAKVLRWRPPAVAKGRAPADRYYRVPIRIRSVRQADDWTLGFGKVSKTIP